VTRLRNASRTRWPTTTLVPRRRHTRCRSRHGRARWLDRDAGRPRASRAAGRRLRHRPGPPRAGDGGGHDYTDNGAQAKRRPVWRFHGLERQRHTDWWHDGYLDGTTSILVRTAPRYGVSGRDEFVWAAVTNSTHANRDSNLNIDDLMYRIVNGIHSWPTIDLFP